MVYVEIGELLADEAISDAIMELAEAGGTPVGIYDRHGDLILGHAAQEPASMCDVKLHGDVIGWVGGGASAPPLASLLSRLAAKEFQYRSNEVNLRRTTDYLEKVFDNSPDAIGIVDEKGRVLKWSKMAEQIYGYSPGELVGQQVFNLYADPEQLSGMLSRLRSEGKVERFQVDMKRKDNSIVPFEISISLLRDDHGEMIGSVCVARNLSDIQRMWAALKAANEQLEQKVDELRLTGADLRRAEERMRAILNNMVDGLLVTDMAGNIDHINRRLVEMTGLGEDAILGKKVGAVFGGWLEKLFEENTRAGNGLPCSTEIALRGGKTGKAVATPIFDVGAEGGDKTDADDETCIGVVVLIRDITAEKEIDRMKTDFISTVSHELRTPLTSILGFARIIARKFDEELLPCINPTEKKIERASKRVAENLKIIISEGERLTLLINDVLDIAKMEAGKTDWKADPISIREVIEHAAASTAFLYEQKGLPLLLEIDDKLPVLIGDRDRLIQVVINLISNAVKFTEEGSIVCRAVAIGNEIVVSVTDSGIGISEEDILRVFEKFKQVGDTLTDKPKGTGLGLPICKQIIEHHGGTIRAESESGKGSTFLFSIPFALRETAATMDIETLVRRLKDHVPTSSATPAGAGNTILVVDDDQHIRGFLRQELEGAGYQVREAVDGVEAVQEVKKELPGLILLDVMMPGINGFDVAAVLKADPATMGIPIIILSILEDKERGYRLGVDKYLTKPVKTELLLQEIALLISHGPSKRMIMVVDENETIVQALSEMLDSRGYRVTAACSGPECLEKAVTDPPDMVIIDYSLSQRHEIVKTLRFEKGLENIYFIFISEAMGDRAC